MIAWSLAALDGVCDAVVINAPEGAGAAALAHSRGIRVLADDAAAPRGPLAGIAAGVGWAKASGFSHLATLPCDTPLIGALEVRRLLVDARDGAFAVTPRGPEPLVAIWPVHQFPISIGDHPSLHRLMRTLGFNEVRFAADAFGNFNTAGALESA